MMADTLPSVPAILAKPFAMLPKRPARLPFEHALNIMFSQPLADGDFEFLDNRVVTVSVEDIQLRFSVTKQGTRLRILRTTLDGDVQISGTVYAFMQLASRSEDTDTLFFQRHLKTSGDTDLGLYVKNLLDGTDLDTMPMQPALGRCLRLALRVADSIESLRDRSASDLASRVFLHLRGGDKQ